MKLVTRADLGWPPSAARSQPTTKGVKVHYEGTYVNPKNADDHRLCVQEWRDIRASHLANTKENYSDIAYNFGVCYHGVVFEGRGVGKETGANGNQDLNHAHYAVCGLLGNTGLTQPSQDMLDGVRDAIDYLRRNGAGNEIRGHRDGYATECPGQPLYDFVLAGAPHSVPPAPKPEPVPIHGEDMTIVSIPTGFEKANGLAVPIPRVWVGSPDIPIGRVWLYFASAFGDAKLVVSIFNPANKAWRDLTLLVKAGDDLVRLDTWQGESKVSVVRRPIDANDKGDTPAGMYVESRQN